MPVSTFGEDFLAMRSARRLSQRDVAYQAGIAVSTISNLERGGACEWRRTTATAVLRALESVAPLSESELSAYMRGVGWSVLPKEIVLAPRRLTQIAEGLLSSAVPAAARAATPPAPGIGAYADALSNLLGADRAAMAMQWLVDLATMLISPEQSSRPSVATSAVPAATGPMGGVGGVGAVGAMGPVAVHREYAWENRMIREVSPARAGENEAPADVPETGKSVARAAKPGGAGRASSTQKKHAR